mmetsp:Transcript_4459/g.8129  ORF Transcript_4459/g.8129 Transcript_4459/m.8129 type:complete len:116 (+) Transcript_4459:810-1157(+)
MHSDIQMLRRQAQKDMATEFRVIGTQTHNGVSKLVRWHVEAPNLLDKAEWQTAILKEAKYVKKKIEYDRRQRAILTTQSGKGDGEEIPRVSKCCEISIPIKIYLMSTSGYPAACP